MAIWKYACKTIQGMELDLKLVSREELSLKLTKAMSGAEGISPTQLTFLTDVLAPVQNLQLLDAVERLKENVVRLPVVLKNKDVTEKYGMRQLGIYAEDPDLGEILYIVLQSDGVEEVPSYEEMKDFTLEWYVNISVSNTEDVEVVINETDVLMKEEGDARYVEKEEGKGLSANDYTTEEKEKLKGIAAEANNYTHPASVAGAKSSGLYKIATDANGHVTGATAVTKTDITALGIPKSDTWRGIQNNLTSDSTTDSLAAAQGKALKGLVDGKAASDHTHNYLPLTGGTMSGLIKMNGSTHYIDTTYGNGIFNQVKAYSLIDLGQTGSIQLGNGMYSFDYIGSISCSKITIGGVTTISGATTVNNTLTAQHVYTRAVSNGGNYNGGVNALHPIVTYPGSNYRATNYINTNSGTPYAISVNGLWGETSWATHNVASASSDIRLKTNISDSKENALDMIDKIQVRQFNWKDSGEYQKIGFIADELEEVDSHFAFGGGYEEDGSMNVKSVDTFYMMGYVVKAIQELSLWKSQKDRQIENMQSQVFELQLEKEKLRNEIEMLKNEIAMLKAGG